MSAEALRSEESKGKPIHAKRRRNSRASGFFATAPVEVQRSILVFRRLIGGHNMSRWHCTLISTVLHEKKRKKKDIRHLNQPNHEHAKSVSQKNDVWTKPRTAGWSWTRKYGCSCSFPRLLSNCYDLWGEITWAQVVPRCVSVSRSHNSVHTATEQTLTRPKSGS